MTGRRCGFTLIEVLVASVIVTVTAGGVMSALITAANIRARAGSAAASEATSYAQQTIEKFRNHVAQDSTRLADEVGGWKPDPLPSLAEAGTDSIVALGAKRCYKISSVAPAQCGGALDCYGIEVKVCWDNGSSCPC